MAAILHADLDGFFIQVEQQKNPHLQDRPVALAQHGDIIAANYAAKAAGVKKHMPPNKARGILKSVNGVVAYVHAEEGGRISYKPYREASATFFEMLNSLELASVVEKGSIDEAFILCNTGSAAHHSTTHMGSSFLDQHALQVASSLAETIRQRTWDSLGMKVSVGVAHNKLLSKLASAAAKPDGVHVVGSESAASELLSKAPVSRLPGFGGKVAQALAEHNIHTAQQVSTLTLPALRTLCNTLTEQSAQKLLECSRGIDNSIPQVKLPPKALTLQMSLTPIPTVLPPSVKGAAPVGGGGKDGKLIPLNVHADDALPRMRSLVRVMLGDLLGRVWHDGEVHGRWPTALLLKIRTNGPTGQFLSRSDRFPPWADLSSWASRSSTPASTSSIPLDRGVEGAQCAEDTAKQLSVQQLQSGSSEAGPHDNVLEAAVRTAVGMFEDMRRAHISNLPVVEVHVGASKFKTSGSSKMKSLTRLFAAGRGKRIRNPEPSVTCISDSPRCIRIGAACTHDGASPRLWPIAAAQREQPSNGRCADADEGRRTSDAAAPIEDSIDAELKQHEQGPHCGFGSPVAGLIRRDSTGTRQRPRHDLTMTRQCEINTVDPHMNMDVPAKSDSVEPILEKSVGVFNRFIDAENGSDTASAQACAQGFLSGGPAGHGDSLFLGSPKLHEGTRNEINCATNAEINMHDCSHDCRAARVAPFDPSAIPPMPKPPKQQEPSCTDNVKRKRSNMSMNVDFMEVLWAWQRNALNGSDVSMVADSIMKGLRQSSSQY